ncbi:Zinc finger, C2H2 type [Aphelenchoides bicaudatus]|nr:Zinc finger, C2H2 type [Aphelenchoides bicaudatus]
MALAVCNKKGGSGSLNPETFNDNNNALFFDRLKYHQTTGRFCDVTISVASTSFRAHRVVLASVSPYFDSLLRYNRIAKEKVCLRYTNVTAFESLLNYMYSGQIVIDRTNVIDLLKYANELMIIKLKSYCIDYLQRNLDASNCVGVKLLSEKYEIPKLAIKASTFFEQNLNIVLHENPDVLDLDEQDMFDMISKYEEAIKPDTYFSLIVRWTNHKLEQRERFFDNLFKLISVRELDIAKVECMLDFNPLFQSEKCLYIVLNELHANNAMNGKYAQKFNELNEKLGNPDNFPDDNEDDESSSMSDLDNESNFAANDEPMDAESERPSLKLKLSLKPTETVRRIAKEKRRRGRPRRTDVLPIINDAETEDQFYTFENENIVNEEFAEADEENPDQLLGDDDGREIIEETVDQNEQQCEHCPFKTRSVARLKRHFAFAHSKNIVYVCNLCQFECKWNRQFYDHMRLHFQGPPFQCDSCSFVVDRMHLLLSHRLTHTDEKPYKCPHLDCPFRSRSKFNLVTHYKVHSGERPFACQKCDKKFALKATLNQHMVAHSELRPFTCGQCDFSTKYQSHLISHRRIHSGDLFRCQEPGCDYSSPKKSQLAAHLRTHLAVRPHRCRTCNRSFIERSHLVRHERIHLTDKPFKCELCSYASARRDKLKEHVLKHHNNSKTSAHKQYRHKNRRARELAELTAKAKNIPPAVIENTFRPIRAEDFESGRNQREQSASAQSMPMNTFDFSANNQSDINMRAGVTRQRSVPIDIQIQQGSLQPQQVQQMHQQPTQMIQQRQMQQNNQQMHLNQQMTTGNTGMMVNTSTFEIPSTSLHRTQSATEPNNFGNNSMLSSSMSLHNYNIHQNDDQSMFNSMLMDRPNSQMPSSHVMSSADEQYDLIRNTSSTDNLSIYGTNRGEMLTPVFGGTNRFTLVDGC